MYEELTELIESKKKKKKLYIDMPPNLISVGNVAMI